MGINKDLKPGDKFNKLEVIKYTGIKNKAKTYLFQCDCGKKKEIRGTSVYTGRTKSCGCNQIESSKSRSIKIDKYTKFKYLTVLDIDSNIKRNGRYYKCICDCGKIKSFRSSNLLDGRSTSCGCITKNDHNATERLCSYCHTVKNIEEFGLIRKDDTKRKGFCKKCNSIKQKLWRDQNKDKIKNYSQKSRQKDKSKFNETKRSAKNRGYDFNVTYEDFLILINRPCFYCGQKNDTKGLDRVDNNKGYLIENVVSCCQQCNLMKRDMSVNDFIVQIENIRGNLCGNQ